MKINKEVKVGLFALIAIAIFYIGMEFLKGINFFSTVKTYHAVYNTIDGLSVSNPVSINGYRVGRVSNIKLLQNRNNKILVSMDISNDILVGDSTKAVLVNSDLLGGKAVVLKIGPVKEPLPTGDTLISEQQQGLAEVLTAKALPVVDKLDSTIYILNSVLSNLANNSDKINNALTYLEGTSYQANQLVAENRKSIRSITNNIDSLAYSLHTTNENINKLVNNFNILGDTLNQVAFKETLDETNKALKNINLAAEKLNSQEGSLGKLINNDSLYNNLNKSAKLLDILLEDLQTNPGRYVNFSIFERRNKGDNDN